MVALVGASQLPSSDSVHTPCDLKSLGTPGSAGKPEERAQLACHQVTEKRLLAEGDQFRGKWHQSPCKFMLIHKVNQ